MTLACAWGIFKAKNHLSRDKYLCKLKGQTWWELISIANCSLSHFQKLLQHRTKDNICPTVILDSLPPFLLVLLEDNINWRSFYFKFMGLVREANLMLKRNTKPWGFIFALKSLIFNFFWSFNAISYKLDNQSKWLNEVSFSKKWLNDVCCSHWITIVIRFNN